MTCRVLDIRDGAFEIRICTRKKILKHTRKVSILLASYSYMTQLRNKYTVKRVARRVERERGAHAHPSPSRRTLRAGHANDI